MRTTALSLGLLGGPLGSGGQGGPQREEAVLEAGDAEAPTVGRIGGGPGKHPTGLGELAY